MAYDFARRDALSRSRGFESYGHERAAKEEAKKLAAYDPDLRERALDVAKQFRTAGERRTQIALYIEGQKAFMAGDKQRARDIAARLPAIRRKDPKVPESIYWYH